MHRIKNLLSVLLAAVIILTPACSAFAAGSDTSKGKEEFKYEEPNGVAEAAANGTFWMEKTDSPDIYRFVNAADGYSLAVPVTMKVTDMSNSSVVSVLENDHIRLEVYVSRPGDGTHAYLNYAYGFRNDYVSHKVTYEATTTIAGMTAYIKQWERDKTRGIVNDHNYYASVDIVKSGTVYNLFFTADQPFWQCGYYQDIASTFELRPITAVPTTIMGESVPKPYWNDETKKLYAGLTATDSSIQWGIYDRYYSGSSYYLNALEENIGYDFKYMLCYASIKPSYDPNLSVNQAKRAYSEGMITELTIQSPLNISGRNMMYDILDGKHDTFLHSMAKDVAAFAHPVLIRLFNEMNGDWCNYSGYNTARDTMIYKKVYVYIWNIFYEEGAGANTLWVWNPNGKSYPDYSWNDASCYYPGNRYVDIVGLTGYNTGTYYSSEKWQTFTQIYDDFYYESVDRYNQPMMITEFSCSAIGGNKPAWIADMFKKIEGYDHIKAAVWWDGYDYSIYEEGVISRDYRIDSPSECINVFRQNLAD